MLTPAYLTLPAPDRGDVQPPVAAGAGVVVLLVVVLGVVLGVVWGVVAGKFELGRHCQ